MAEDKITLENKTGKKIVSPVLFPSTHFTINKLLQKGPEARTAENLISSKNHLLCRSFIIKL